MRMRGSALCCQSSVRLGGGYPSSRCSQISARVPVVSACEAGIECQKAAASAAPPIVAVRGKGLDGLDRQLRTYSPHPVASTAKIVALSLGSVRLVSAAMCTKYGKSCEIAISPSIRYPLDRHSWTWRFSRCPCCRHHQSGLSGGQVPPTAPLPPWRADQTSAPCTRR